MYKRQDFDPAFVESELAARIAVIEKDNEEAKRLGKTLKNVPKYISFSQLTEEVLKQAEEDAKAELKAEGLSLIHISEPTRLELESRIT